MAQRTIPAIFMRGGTSKAVMFDRRDLPQNMAEWDCIFLAAMGSPDPYGRQLDGMGGGISSVSKVCVVSPSSRPDADVDYTFAQIQIREASVGYRGNCGNMSSAVGPFALDQGMVHVDGDIATVRIFNTNTGKLIHATFPVENSSANYCGNLAIPGVSGTGAAIRLDFLSPGGATTGTVLPTGNSMDCLNIPGLGPIDASMVDAANACVFIRAHALGLTGRELPDELDARPDVMRLLQAIRVHASVAMGIAKTEEEARAIGNVPFIALVSAAADAPTLTGGAVSKGEIDLSVRVISSGQPHRALPLTIALCTAAAARIEGTIVASMLSPEILENRQLRLGMPSGILTVEADVIHTPEGALEVRSGSYYRTARVLFSGLIHLS